MAIKYLDYECSATEFAKIYVADSLDLHGSDWFYETDGDNELTLTQRLEVRKAINKQVVRVQRMLCRDEIVDRIAERQPFRLRCE